MTPDRLKTFPGFENIDENDLMDGNAFLDELDSGKYD